LDEVLPPSLANDPGKSAVVQAAQATPTPKRVEEMKVRLQDLFSMCDALSQKIKDLSACRVSDEQAKLRLNWEIASHTAERDLLKETADKLALLKDAYMNNVRDNERIQAIIDRDLSASNSGPNGK
jgi:hypothetical protein